MAHLALSYNESLTHFSKPYKFNNKQDKGSVNHRHYDRV